MSLVASTPHDGDPCEECVKDTNGPWECTSYRGIYVDRYDHYHRRRLEYCQIIPQVLGPCHL
ncbi:hypothetical protein BGZ90_009270, partial [Linnemannia elongata]